MVMSPADVVALANDVLIPAHVQRQIELNRIDAWYRWEQEDVQAPTGATKELKRLIALAKTPWLRLVVTNVAQNLVIDGYRTPDVRDDSPIWRSFKSNGLDRGQGGIHRAATAYGLSYGLAMPGIDELAKRPSARLRGISPRKMTAVYADLAGDDWPLYAIWDTGPRTWRVFDDEAVYFLGTEDDGKGGTELKYLEWRAHPAEVTPVVRFSNMLDLEGRTDGEVEPYIGVAKRLTKTTFDRLMIQHFNSWKVRTVAGMAEPETEAEARRSKLRLRQDDLLVAEDPDTKFGTLDETPLDGMLQAYASDVRSLAAVSQTPTHALTGDLINLSAEALAAARAELDAKVGERQLSLGASWSQFLRLGAYIDGDYDAAQDVLAEVVWRDTSVRSLAQAADALGKLATMLQVPVEALWEMIPTVSRTDVQDWKRLKEEAAAGDPMALLASTLDGQATMQPEVDPAKIKAQADAMGVLIRSGVEPADAAAQSGFGPMRFTGAVPTSLRVPEGDAADLEAK